MQLGAPVLGEQQQSHCHQCIVTGAELHSNKFKLGHNAHSCEMHFPFFLDISL